MSGVHEPGTEECEMRLLEQRLTHVEEQIIQTQGNLRMLMGYIDSTTDKNQLAVFLECLGQYAKRSHSLRREKAALMEAHRVFVGRMDQDQKQMTDSEHRPREPSGAEDGTHATTADGPGVRRRMPHTGRTNE